MIKYKYKKFFKYITYFVNNKLLSNLINMNFFIGNLYYYSNSSYIGYQNFLYINKCKSHFLSASNNNLRFNLKKHTVRINFNTLLMVNFLSDSFLTKRGFSALMQYKYLDLVYLKLITHNKLLSILYLHNIFLNVANLYQIQIKLLIFLRVLNLTLCKLFRLYLKKNVANF